MGDREVKYDYNEYIDSDGNKYNKISLLESVIQSYRITDKEYNKDNKKGHQQNKQERQKKTEQQNKMESNVPTVKNPNGFNINAAVSWIWQNSYYKYSRDKCGHCARNVRKAINVGFGYPPDDPTGKYGIKGYPRSAYQYAGYLPKIGFKEIINLYTKEDQANWSNSSAYPGDIAVMSHERHGHICMWAGRQWVSDFKQNNMWPYGGNGHVKIFRFM